MGAIYSASFDNILTSGAADNFDTAIAVIAGDTAGLRARILEVAIGFSTDAPTDDPVAVRMSRIDDVSAGSAGTAATTITVANIFKFDSASPNSPCSAKLDYSVEPTTYLTNYGPQFEIQDRGLAIVPLHRPIIINRDQAFGVIVGPRVTVAQAISGYVIWEAF